MHTVVIYNEEVGDYNAVYRSFNIDAADATYNALSEKFINAAFDVWPDGDTLPYIDDASWWLSKIA